MRSDDELALPETVPGERPSPGLENGESFSGHERNHLFLRRGPRFLDVSPVSGLDDEADGRAFGILDYDRDGWADLAVVNANSPQFQLFHNEVAAAAGAEPGRSLALRFVGGNRAAAPSAEWSTRDGYGAQARVTVGDRTLLREHRCGEGMAAQNSPTQLVGIGDAAGAEAIEVRWPSGKVTRVGPVAAGRLVTFYENPADSPDGTGVRVEPYGPAVPVGAPEPAVAEPASAPRLTLRSPDATPPARLRVYTTMATWCTSCRRELPRLRQLRARFPADEVALLAVPVDPADTPEKLAAYVETYDPPYRLLTGLPAADVAAVTDVVRRALHADALPATIVTDRDGRILDTRWGVPSASELRRLLRGEDGGAPVRPVAS